MQYRAFLIAVTAAALALGGLTPFALRATARAEAGRTQLAQLAPPQEKAGSAPARGESFCPPAGAQGCAGRRERLRGQAGAEPQSALRRSVLPAILRPRFRRRRAGEALARLRRGFC